MKDKKSIYNCEVLDICLPDYFSGDHRLYVQVPLTFNTVWSDVPELLFDEINSGYIANQKFNSRRFYRQLEIAIENFQNLISEKGLENTKVGTYIEPEPPEGFDNYDEYFSNTVFLYIGFLKKSEYLLPV